MTFAKRSGNWRAEGNVRVWCSTDLARCPAFGRCQGLNGPNADIANRSFVKLTPSQSGHKADLGRRPDMLITTVT